MEWNFPEKKISENLGIRLKVVAFLETLNILLKGIFNLILRSMRFAVLTNFKMNFNSSVI